jgi:replicative DNA helicase
VTYDDRIPPNDLAAEQCVLGSMLISPNAISDVIEMLHGRDFYRPAHQTVYERILDMYGRGDPADAITVKDELLKRGELGRVGDAPYLHTLVASVPTAANAGYYAKIVREKARLRRLIEAGTQIVALGQDANDDDADHATGLAQKLLDEAGLTTSSSSAKSVADLITPYMDLLENGGDQRGVTTGWVDVDRVLKRLRPGQLITVGARPGMGKSVVLADLAYHVGIKLGLPVYVNTLEMSEKEFMDRLVAYDAKVNLTRLIEPELLTEDDWSRLSGSLSRMATADMLIVDDDPHVGVMRIRETLREMRRSGQPAALVCIDYLQLMEMAGKSENRQLEVSAISRSLKLLAKEFEVPIVIGSQLNRNVEQRADKRPNASDLRESGSVEQDSDVVILLYREDHYDPESPRAGEVDFIIDKHRSGPRGTVTLAFQGHYSRIVDMAKPGWSPTGGLQ